MLKVAHILFELKPSGAEAMLRCAASMWRDHNVESEIVATGPQIGPYASTLRSAGYKVHHIPNSRSFSYLIVLWRFLKKEKYDVVHLHVEGMSFWLGLTALVAGCGVLRTVHNNFQFEGNLRLRRGVQRRFLEFLGLVYVAIGESVAANERKRFGINPLTVMNWADLEGLSPPTPNERAAARAHFGFSNDQKVLLTLGNCSPVKNHSILIEALSHCRDVDGLRYLHMGLEDSLNEERKLAEQLGIADRVVFGGWAPSPKQALHAADFYVMPSLYEGFSIAALEALSIGLPSVLTNVPGLSDLKSFFPNIYYSEPNSKELARVIRSVAGDEVESLRVVSDTYREIALEKFTARRGVAEYAGIYKNLSSLNPEGGG